MHLGNKQHLYELNPNTDTQNYLEEQSGLFRLTLFKKKAKSPKPGAINHTHIRQCTY